MTKVEGGPWDGFEIISTYSDAQAVEDGLLVDISARLDPSSARMVRGARATLGIFSRFVELSRTHFPEMNEDAHREDALLSCRLLYRAIMRKAADADGWRKAEGRLGDETVGEV